MSTKEYGCFFCAGKSNTSTGTCPQCGQPIDIGQHLGALRIEDYRIMSVIGRGFYGWTVKVEDAFQLLAMKIIPALRFENQEMATKEPRALVQCGQPPHPNIARFHRLVHSRVSICGKDVDVSCMVFEYIANARPLRVIIEDDQLLLTRADVVAVLAGIASGLERMHGRGLWHDDLHDDNILVRTVEPDENLRDRYEAKLIDFGSTKQKLDNKPERGARSDYSYLAKHIYGLVARFEKGNLGHLTPLDRSFADQLRRLGHRLDDRDVSRRNLEPKDIAREIRAALEETTTGYEFPTFEEMIDQVHVSLKEPLENTNAINLAPQDIALLFVDSLGWTDRMNKSEPVVVVGPRGCGKTMLLRYLSMSSQARPQKVETSRERVAARLATGPYVGFLVSVAQLRTPFLRSAYKKLEENDKAVAEDFCREFINAHFVLAVLRTVMWLHREKLAAVTKDDIATLGQSASKLLEGLVNGLATDIENLIEVVERRTAELSNLKSPETYKPTSLCRDDVLVQLSRAVLSAGWAKSKECWYLLDDYSVTMLTPFIQRAYNPVLFRLAYGVRIKISSEGDGPILEDHLGRKYKEGRELSRVNLGEIYFQAKEEEGRLFFEHILDARFKEIGRGSLDKLKTLLGEHISEEGFGKYIISLKRPGDTRFYGFGLLCRLCSGDVSFIIELLNLLTQGRDLVSTKPIPIADQDAIVKRFSQRQLADLRRISDHGPRLYDIAEGLGKLLKNCLIESPNRDDPDERLRIELEGTGELSAEAQEVQAALLRHSVLIDGGSGKSRQGLPTRRLYFRRLFAPCFPFSPARKGSIALTYQLYQQWILQPTSIWRKPPKQQDGPLFSGEA
jgi:energy-coupling factor transporter ATP-binding protein EcfA2